LAYRASQAAGNKHNKKNNKKNDKKQEKKKQGDKGNQKPKKKGDGKQEPKIGKMNKQPPVERLRLPPEQAEQLLNAVGQHEQQAVKAVPAAPPVRGKDW
jgi:hypothetical protein